MTPLTPLCPLVPSLHQWWVAVDSLSTAAASRVPNMSVPFCHANSPPCAPTHDLGYYAEGNPGLQRSSASRVPRVIETIDNTCSSMESASCSYQSEPSNPGCRHPVSTRATGKVPTGLPLAHLACQPSYCWNVVLLEARHTHVFQFADCVTAILVDSV